MDSILLQKQIRDNTKDVQNYLSELKNWEAEMKRKEENLKATSGEEGAPPIRNKVIKMSNENIRESKTSNQEKAKRISSYDYSGWDNFDVDKACEEVDAQEPHKTSSSITPNCREEANYEKELGNKYVKSQEWKKAIECYSRAIKCYSMDAIFYANRALCFLKLNDLKSAETDCTAALQLDPNYVKALQRRALARVSLNQLQEAKVDILKVLELEPKNTVSRAELFKLEKKLNSNKVLAKVPVKDIKNEQEEVYNLSRKTDISVPGAKIKCEPCVKKEEQIAIVESANLENLVRVKKEEQIASVESANLDNLVRPIHKPPHIRSKKPMKRIEIQEINEENVNLIKFNEVPTLRNNTTECTQGENITKKVPESIETGKYESIVDIIEVDMKIPPPPTSSIQFLAAWNKLKHNSDQRFHYLLKIAGSEFRNIFQDSMESKTLSEIIQVLVKYFITNKTPVFSYLLGLSNVRRFGALTLFFSREDKEGILKLVEYCKDNDECTEEELIHLKNKYEI